MPTAEQQVLGTEIERVNPKVPVLFERESRFYSQLEKRPVEIISSRDMKIPLEIRPGGNFGHYSPDGGDLGRGEGPDFDKGVINTVHLKHAIEWTTQSQWSTDDSRKSVINLFRRLMAKAMPEFRRNVDSLCMTDGTGTLATITTVSTAGGVDTYTCTTDGFGVKLLRPKLKLNVFTSTLLTNRTAGGETQITFYDLVNKTIKVTPAVVNATGGDLIVSSGLTATPPSSIYGVKYHDNSSSTGTWLGFNRANTPEVIASRVNALSGPLTLPFPRLAINKVGDRVGEEALKRCQAWMHPCQKQAYEELGFQASMINKTAKAEGLDLYFGDNMQMAGAPVKTSYSWDKTRIDFIDLDNWGRAEYHKPGFYEVDGRKIFEIRGPSGGVATSQVFYIVASFNIYALNPAALTYIDALAVPTGY